MNSLQIVDSTLREGDQFALARFSAPARSAIARALDDFGIDVIEHTSPSASPGSEASLRSICGLGLRAQVVSHVRCNLDDVRLSVDCGVDGAQLFCGVSQVQRRSGHRRSLTELYSKAAECVQFLGDHALAARVSCEDAFRASRADVLETCRQAQNMGAQRVGLADTVGTASPEEVRSLVGAVRAAVDCEIEFHGHNDSGCAVINASAALEAGATHLDVSVLGIGERNGITPLAGLMARLFAQDPGLVTHYELQTLPALDQLVAQELGLEIPFNACLTGAHAFTHKAGVHTGAVLREPGTYEAFDPAVFGRERRVLLGHALAGRHALGHRACELGVELDPIELERALRIVKSMADAGPVSEAQVDAVLHGVASVAREVIA